MCVCARRAEDGSPRVARYDPAAGVCNGEAQSACISKAGTPIETAEELAPVGDWQTIQVRGRGARWCSARSADPHLSPVDSLPSAEPRRTFSSRARLFSPFR